MIDKNMYVDLQLLFAKAREALSVSQIIQANEYAAEIWNNEMLTRNQIIAIATQVLLED